SSAPATRDVRSSTTDPRRRGAALRRACGRPVTATRRLCRTSRPPWRRAPNPSPHIAAPLPAPAAPERRRSEAIYTPVPHLLSFPAARRRAGPVAPCRPRPRPRRGRRRGPARQRGPRRSGGGDLPSVRPQPRTMEPGEHGMDLGGKVSIIVGRDTDPAALSDLEALLERPGGPVDV